MCKFRCDTYKTAKICFHYMFSFHFQCFDVLSVVYSLSLSIFFIVLPFLGELNFLLLHQEPVI